MDKAFYPGEILENIIPQLDPKLPCRQEPLVYEMDITSSKEEEDGKVASPSNLVLCLALPLGTLQYIGVFLLIWRQAKVSLQLDFVWPPSELPNTSSSSSLAAFLRHVEKRTSHQSAFNGQMALLI